MKLNKKIFTILSLVLIAFLPIQAQKKPPQIPLKELTDPSSPNYVPYPYPKTDFQIIEDFKYGVKFLFGDKTKHFSVINGDISDIKLILKLLEEDSALRVTNIIRVENMVQTSPCLYNFVLQIEDENGKVVAVGELED